MSALLLLRQLKCLIYDSLCVVKHVYHVARNERLEVPDVCYGEFHAGLRVRSGLRYSG